MTKKWTEVVPPTELDTAQSAFDRWLTANGLGRVALADDEIRVDVMRTVEGDRMRFLVLTEKLRKLGIREQ